MTFPDVDSFIFPNIQVVVDTMVLHANFLLEHWFDSIMGFLPLTYMPMILTKQCLS